jgi:PilZ domain-containing protein
MSEERRRFTRVPFSVTAEMTLNNKAFTAKHIMNLSIGGCLLPIELDVEKGTPCVVKILLSGKSSELNVRVDGEISRCASYGAAVKFNKIDPDSLFHLQNIVRYNSPNSDLIEQEILDHPGLE